MHVVLHHDDPSGTMLELRDRAARLTTEGYLGFENGQYRHIEVFRDEQPGSTAGRWTAKNVVHERVRRR